MEWERKKRGEEKERGFENGWKWEGVVCDTVYDGMGVKGSDEVGTDIWRVEYYDMHG